MSTQALTFTVSQDKSLMGLAFIVGGLLWIATFVQIIVIGSLTDILPATPAAQLPWYVVLGLYLFLALIFGLNIGLGTLLVQTYKKETKLSMVTAVLMAGAIVLAAVNMATLSGFTELSSFSYPIMGGALLATTAAAGLLGIALIRSQVLPRWVAETFLFVAVTTFVGLLGMLLPSGRLWATTHLTFLLSGFIYTLASGGLWAAEP